MTKAMSSVLRGCSLDFEIPLSHLSRRNNLMSLLRIRHEILASYTRIPNEPL